jgi:acetolactate synthase-1/2/3 large subunit
LQYSFCKRHTLAVHISFRRTTIVAKVTGGRYIAEFLQAYGVRAFFFVPAILSRALSEMDDMPIKRVLAHTENAAVYMADGYARAACRPGVVAGQAVGSGNIAGGLREAKLAHSPVIAFTGGRRAKQKYKHAYQELDDFPLFDVVCKRSFQVDAVERLPDLLRQAFRAATSSSPGPVNLQLAGKQGEIEDDSAELELVVEQSFTSVPALRPTASRENLAEAALHINRALRPLIVMGGGARWSQAGPAVLKFAEANSIPIATSLSAFALTPENHRLYFGVPGTYSRASTNQILHLADLIIFVGSQTGGQVTHFWSVPPPGSTVIQIGIEPEDLGRNYPNVVSLWGDAQATVEALGQAIGPLTKSFERERWVEEVQNATREWRKTAEVYRASDSSPMRPERILREIAKGLPSETIFVCDTGHAGMWCSQQLWVDHTDWTFLRSAGSLGWAFPAAIGAKCAFPEKPVVCFTGDGGLWYHIQELETAVRCRIPTVTCVNNNDSLNQELPIFERVYGDRPEPKHRELWNFSKVNFAEIAKSMGANGIRIDKASELSSALERALSSNLPTVLDMHSDIDAFAPVAWETPAV